MIGSSRLNKCTFQKLLIYNNISYQYLFLQEKGLTSEQMAEELRDKLGKKTLTQYESDITYFPRRCMMCDTDNYESYNFICAGVALFHIYFR